MPLRCGGARLVAGGDDVKHGTFLVLCGSWEATFESDEIVFVSCLIQAKCLGDRRIEPAWFRRLRLKSDLRAQTACKKSSLIFFDSISLPGSTTINEKVLVVRNTGKLQPCSSVLEWHWLLLPDNRIMVNCGQTRSCPTYPNFLDEMTSANDITSLAVVHAVLFVICKVYLCLILVPRTCLSLHY